MLVLSRRVGERIKVGENAEIIIANKGIENGQVKIGIIAPKGIPVHHEEVWQRIQQARVLRK